MGGNGQRIRLKDISGGIAVLLFLAGLTFVWFVFFPYNAFMGDDLKYIVWAFHGGANSSFVKALTLDVNNKYRPVSAIIFHIETLMFGRTFHSYVFFNIVLEFMNVCLVAFLSWRLSRKHLLVGLSAGILFVVSRFSYYNVIQAIGGPIEGAALFLFLALLITVFRAYDKKNPYYFAWSLILFLLLTLTHERFLAAGLFLVIAILIAPVKFRNSANRVFLSMTPLLVLIFNFLIKTFVFRSLFFEGTGGHVITFHYHRFALFLIKGLLNLVGFNAGPNYLSGLFFLKAGLWGIALGCFFFFAILILIIVYFRHKRESEELLLPDSRMLLLFFALLVPLVAVASISIRQEYRWLYAPYAVIILAIAFLTGRISGARWRYYFLITLILVAGISVDTFYRTYLNNVFFVDGLRVADSGRAAIIDKYGTALEGKKIFLLGCGGAVKSWYFQGNKFFRFYTGDPEMDVHYVDNLSEIGTDREDTGSLLVFALDAAKREFKDVSSKVKRMLSVASDFRKQPGFDFLANYSRGKINSTRKVSTPTGHGVLAMNWPGGVMGTERTLTIIAGFNYTFYNMTVNRNDFLSFTAGIPFDTSDGAIAYVDVTPSVGERRRIFEVELSPATKDGIRWKSFLISCEKFAGKGIAITFGTEAVGSPKADWVAFGSPLLLVHK